MKKKIAIIKEQMKTALLDESKRIELQFVWVFCVLMVVAFGMSIVNIFTDKLPLMLSTLIFGVLCAVNVFLAKRSRQTLTISSWLFSVEIIALLTYFIVSGTPEGFSAIWACLLPASGLLLFRRKRGTILCAVMLVIIVFFFQTKIGNSMLQYQYTESFKLRFPMLYVAFFAVSFLLETIRAITFEGMEKAQERYEYFYRHDALTEVYNRYGFNERMAEIMGGNKSGVLAFYILDLDHFKDVNDTYGHLVGDVVLKEVASLVTKTVGANADVCRWGGEEFAIMLTGDCDAVERGNAVIEALNTTPVLADGKNIFVTASIGAVVCDNIESVTLTDFVRTADSCLYSAKENGRNRMVYKKIGDNEAKQEGRP